MTVMKSEMKTYTESVTLIGWDLPPLVTLKGVLNGMCNHDLELPADPLRERGPNRALDLPRAIPKTGCLVSGDHHQ
jgi:hypothetical protein